MSDKGKNEWETVILYGSISLRKEVDGKKDIGWDLAAMTHAVCDNGDWVYTLVWRRTVMAEVP